MKRSPSFSQLIVSSVLFLLLVASPPLKSQPAVTNPPMVDAPQEVNGTPGTQGGDKIKYTVTITNTGTAAATSVTYTNTVDANTTLDNTTIQTTPIAVNESYSTTGNVTLTVVAGSGVLANDFDADLVGPGLTVSAGATSANGGTVSMNTDGSFSYTPPPGFEGTDTFTYTLNDGEGNTDVATVTITISGSIWFINNNPGAPGTSPGTGTLANPFKTLAAFQAVNNNTGNNPVAGDNIFIYESATNYIGPVTLLSTQKLIGQDATSSLSTITGLTTNSAAFPAMSSGNATIVNITSGTNDVNLGSGNRLQGFTLGNATGTALSGTSFGTVTIADVGINTTGQAINLNTGGLAGGFTGVSSSGGTNNVSFVNVTSSSAIDLGGGAMSGATFSAFIVNGGTVSLTYAGNITNATTSANDALLNTFGGHTGTLTFNTGTLSATNGVGIFFDNADGTYNFNGTTTFNGNTAHIQIQGGSGGTFSFASGTSVTNNSGNACFRVVSSTPSITYSGSLTRSGTSSGDLVSIATVASGTITFQTGTLSSTSSAGTGIQISDADGTVNFNGTTTLNGGDAGVDIVSGSSGTISFGANASIISPSGTAFRVNGSTPGLTYSGSITQANNALMLDITDQASGTITFQTGTLSASNGNGIVLTNVDGTVNASGIVTLSGGNAHLEVLAGTDGTNGSQGTVNFSSTNASSKIENPSGGVLVKVAGSMPTLTYAGTLTRTSNLSNHAVDVQTNKGGTYTLSGASKTLNASSTASSEPVFFNGNTGGTTLAFTGGGLSISSGSLTGLLASNTAIANATLKVQGTGNTITSPSATALSVTNTTIGTPAAGEGGLNFQSISSGNNTAAADPANGIVLNTTGSSGGLTVTGGSNTSKGGDASGGTIQNINGADGTTAGIGIYLNSTSSVVLRRMTINGAIQNMGIHGLSVSGFTLQYSTISGTIGTTSGSNDLNLEGPIVLGRTAPSTADGLFGTGLIDNCIIRDGIQHNTEFYNQSGTHSLTISNSDIKSNGSALGSDGIQAEMIGSAISTISVQHCTLEDNKSQAMQVSALGSSTVDVTVNACMIKKTSQGNEGVLLQNGANGDLTVHFTNDTLTGIPGTMLNVGQVVNNATSSANLIAVIKKNIFTQGSPVANRALIFFPSSTNAAGNVATSNVLIDSNHITSSTDAEALFVSTPDPGTSPSFTATVTNNVVTMTSTTGSAIRGIAIQATQGTTAAGAAACLDVRANTVTYTNGAPAGINGLRVRQANPGGGAANPTINLEQGSSGSAVPATVLSANNPGSTTEVAGTVTVVGNSTCLAPPN